MAGRVARTVAGVIDDQLLSRGWIIPTSWGITHKAITEHPGTLGGLSFRVAARKFRGTVAIDLTLDDTYTVRFLRGGRVVHKADDVYADRLVDLIDGVVERP